VCLGGVVPKTLWYSGLILAVLTGIGVSRYAGIYSRAAQEGNASLTILTSGHLHLGFLNRPYHAFFISGSPEITPAKWSVSSGALPPGLRLNSSSGEVAGAPAQGGSFSFTITATDSRGTTASKFFNVDILEVPLDEYGGFAEKHSPHGKTGFFRLEKVGNRWLFVDPLGNYFFPIFVEDVNPNDGGPAYEKALAAKYAHSSRGSFPEQAVRRLRSWGFNSLSVSPAPYVLPIPTYSGNSSNNEKMPFYDFIKPALYGVRDGGVQDLIFGSDPAIYDGWRGASFPDVYSPLFPRSIEGQIVEKKRIYGPALDRIAWLIGMGMDDLDNLFGWRNRTNSPHTGWLTAVTSPIQTFSVWPHWAVLRNLHTDTQVYTKTAWSLFLQKKYGSIQALNAAWKSNYTTFGTSAVPNTGEVLGTGDGTAKNFSKALAHGVVDPHSVAVFENGKLIAGDDGRGHVGAPGDSIGGSVNYARGSLSVTFKAPPHAGHAITVNYYSSGWPKRIADGTGLLDEDGSSPWIGRDYLALSDTNPTVKADMDAFLQQQLDTYFSQMSSAIHAWLPHHLIFGPAGLSPAARPVLFQEASKYMDCIGVSSDDFDVQPAGGLSQAFLSVYSYFQKPIEASTFVTSQKDSPWAKSPRSFDDYPTQAARGQAYATQLGTVVDLKGPDGIYFVIDFDIFAWTDKLGESANFGLVSSLDNAYDGFEDQIAIGYDSWGFKTGGERANYGDFIGAVEAANLSAIKKVALGIATSRIE
jgi:hypothetical protein